MPRQAPRAVLLALAWALALPAPARAGACAGVELPEVVTVGGAPLKLSGMGLREVSVLRIDVYVAALYLEQPARSADEVLEGLGRTRLTLHFVRATERERIVGGLRRALLRTVPADPAAAAERNDAVASLDAWIPDMTEGEPLGFDYVPGTGTTVIVGKDARGTIPGADFARLLFGNWLGPHAVDRRLEARLLEGGCG